MARISYNGTTNSQGVASATITGQGKGRLRFISKCDDLWSNEIEIDDYLFYDKAVTGSANPNWYDNNYGTVNVGSDGTLLTSKNTTIFLMHNASNDSHTSSDQYIWNTPFVVEFDVVSMSGTGTDTQFQVYSDETTKNWATGLSGVGHYKAIVFDGNQRLYKDEELQTNQQSYSLPNCRITLRVRNNVSLKYKNFMIYPVFSAPKHYTPISLSSSSSIIQTGESATLSATLTNVLGEPMANTSVNFIEDGTVIATASTNSQGVASTTITSNGTGERTFKASKDNVESDNTTIEDDKYYNDGTDLSTLTIPSNASVTVENGALKITTSTSGEKKIPYSFSLTSSDNYIFECEIAKLGTGQPIALYVKDSTTANGLWFAYDISTNKWNGGCGSPFNNITTSTLAVGDKIRIKQENGVFTLYHNDMVIKSITRTLSGTYSIGHYTNSGRIQYIDNIKLWSI